MRRLGATASAASVSPLRALGYGTVAVSADETTQREEQPTCSFARRGLLDLAHGGLLE